jgi:hypothetical protein
MANVNSYCGVYNVPKQDFGKIASATEVALLVPAMGLYPEYPNPQYAAASGLGISAGYDFGTGGVIDGYPFKIKLVMEFVNGGSDTLTVDLYQVPLSILGTVGATGSVNANGAPVVSSSLYDILLDTAAVTGGTASGHLWREWIMHWDSTSDKLDGLVRGCVNNSAEALTAMSAGAITITSAKDLNFILSFTFGTGAATNSVTVLEFTIEKL